MVIPKLATMIPAMQARRLVSMATTDDESTNEIARLIAVEKMEQRAWCAATNEKVNWGKVRAEDLDMARIDSTTLMKHEFKKWTKLQTQGLGIEVFENDKISNQWCRDPA